MIINDSIMGVEDHLKGDTHEWYELKHDFEEWIPYRIMNNMIKYNKKGDTHEWHGLKQLFGILSGAESP